MFKETQGQERSGEGYRQFIFLQVSGTGKKMKKR